ncbi:MAG TPA: hypothetical protein VNN17_13435 [Terriglobia bacterium]|nr:hypothetical protein [Terriglobia bacterium]
MARPTDADASLKHDLRRGEIIWVLKQDYPHLITFRHLQLALRDRNIPLGKRDLESYLSYLEEGGFVRCQRHYEEPEARSRILAAALTARGLLLLDGKLTDPGVRF